uniref:PHD finger protein 12 n=1 Tax=Esox lucius TaxID=8010 RepID=A0A3P8YL51_ESOLU
MWDKMETPTIVYDLDTSGGLMEQIQTLLAPPKSDGEKRSRRSERDVRRSGRATNHDTCDSCHEGGDLLCCDHCPAAFHLQCCNPPLSEEMLPPGDWVCHRCNVYRKKREQKAEQTNGLLERERALAKPAGPGLRVASVHLKRLECLERRASSWPGTPATNVSSADTAAPPEERKEADKGPVTDARGSETRGSASEAAVPAAPRLLKRPFQLLISAAMEMNPTQFQLPSELTSTTALPGSSKRRRKDELIMRTSRRPQHEMDPNGLVPLPVRVCFSCTRSCRLAPLIQCDYCPLLFHMDCLDPPLTAMPMGKWMCPNHIEHLVLNQRSLTLTSRCQLLDQFQDRISQHAVKVDFLRWVHRQNPPVRHGASHHKTKTLKVPDAIKSQYQSPPVMLAPAGVRNGELICNGVPDQERPERSPQYFTSQAEQQEWLQDVVALQCSIMRHLSTRQNSSDWGSKQAGIEHKDVKPRVAADELCSLPCVERTASPPPAPCAKPCSTPVGPQGAPVPRSLWDKQDRCSCGLRPFQNCLKCWRPNGPLAERPMKANGAVGCDAASDSSSPEELQLHRLIPPLEPPNSASATAVGLPHRQGGVVVKTEKGTPLECCTQKDCPPSPSPCAPTGQVVQNPAHGTPPAKAGAPTISLSRCGELKLSPSPTPGVHVFTPPRVIKDSSTARRPSTSPPCIYPGPDPKGSSCSESSVFPSSLSSSLAAAEASVLLPPPGFSRPRYTQTVRPRVSPLRFCLERCRIKCKSSGVYPPFTEQKKVVQARATFYPLMGKGRAVNMPYRTLYIGAGADMDVCLTDYGHCNYVSGKHACIFFDENTKHYELLNYSEHGTTVDNVLYSCDFSEKASPSPTGGLVSKVQGLQADDGSGPRTGVAPPGGVMSCQPQGGPRLSCNCKASSSSLIGGSGAGWEGTALLHHGSYIKLGCMQFVFSIAEFASKQPKEETTTINTTAPANATVSPEVLDKQTLKFHQVPLVLRSNSVP